MLDVKRGHFADHNLDDHNLDDHNLAHLIDTGTPFSHIVVNIALVIHTVQHTRTRLHSKCFDRVRPVK
jgi:hypothetical protein